VKISFDRLSDGCSLKNIASLMNLQTNFASCTCITAGLIKSLLLKSYMFIKGILYSFLNKLYWGHWKRKCTSSSTFVGENFQSFDQLVFLLYHIYQFLLPKNVHWFLILSACILDLNYRINQSHQLMKTKRSKIYNNPKSIIVMNKSANINFNKAFQTIYLIIAWKENLIIFQKLIFFL
jgi:hypothetical protein